MASNCGNYGSEMMRFFKNLRRKFDIMLMVTFIFYIGMVMMPQSYWYTLNEAQPLDTPVGEKVLMDVKQTIFHDFHGFWTVEIYKRTNKGFVKYCTASGENNYNADSVLPEPVTIKWWAPSNASCFGINLPLGEYYMTTSHTVDMSFVPDKTKTIRSNVFRIYNPAKIIIEQREGYRIIRRPDGEIQQVIPDRIIPLLDKYYGPISNPIHN